MTVELLGGDGQSRVWAGLLGEAPGDMGNPGPVRWPYPEFVTPDMEGPIPGTQHPCGCHLRRGDCEAILCDEHLAELNHRVDVESGDPS